MLQETTTVLGEAHVRPAVRQLLLIGAAVLPLMSAVAVSRASADVLFDNTGSSPSGSGDAISNTLYASFSVGSAPEMLTSITLALFGNASPPTVSDGGAISVTLYSDASTSPNSALDYLGTINDSAVTSTDGNNPTLIALSQSTPYLLNADSRYWVQLADYGNPTPTSAMWASDIDGSGTNVAGEFTINTINGGSPVSNVNGAYMMLVNGVPVPEPGTLALYGSAIAMLSLLVISRRMKPSR